jgi:hypothetical protein
MLVKSKTPVNAQVQHTALIQSRPVIGSVHRDPRFTRERVHRNTPGSSRSTWISNKVCGPDKLGRSAVRDVEYAWE